MNEEINKNFDLSSVKSSILKCVKAVGKNEESLKDSDFDGWYNDYNKSWQLRFTYDLQCLQQSINLVNDALVQKELSIIDDALRGAVLHSSALATTFEYITSDLMHLRHVLKDSAIEKKS